MLYKHQYGLRKNHSTNLALLTLIDRIVQAFENREMVLGVFLDFSKAFDTVDHNILIEKLHCYGIRGVALEWIKHYLCDRKQYVVYKNIKSFQGNIKCGVPQGSILGPLLFLIYVNDMANVSDILFPILFADDTSVFVSGKNLIEMTNKINIELKKIVVWLKVNKLSLNVSKTRCILFKSPRQKIKQLYDISINDQVIDYVDHIKFLGVVIDASLSWSYHVKYVCSNISKGIGIIGKVKNIAICR